MAGRGNDYLATKRQNPLLKHGRIHLRQERPVHRQLGSHTPANESWDVLAKVDKVYEDLEVSGDRWEKAGHWVNVDDRQRIC